MLQHITCHLISSGIMLALAISGFIIFCCVHKNFAIGFWSMLLGNLAAVSFHLNWVKGKETLQKWYSKKSLRHLHTIGFLSAVAGFVSLIWYLFTQFYYNSPVLPYEHSVVTTAVWATLCGIMGIILMHYSHKYRLVIEEIPILTESNA
ncbi:hypothetical protein ANTRET_LOCUS4830 [Anthophora retusa]